MTARPVDVLAVAICDAFFAAITPPDPTRWRSADIEQRQTFQRCAEAALEAGRRVQRSEGADLELAVGEAIAGAFWPPGQVPPFWLTWRGASQSREVYLRMARAAIDAGRRLRAARSREPVPA